jgi:hypothetical protein
VSGIDRSQDNKNGGLDASALLNGIVQGQGTKPSTGNISGGIANQITGKESPSIDQIIGGPNGPGQGVAKGQTRAAEQNNVKEDGVAIGKGWQQGISQDNGGNGRIVQIEQTIITEANGQQIKTEVIKDVGKASAAPAPAPIPHQAPPADAKPTPPPAAMPGMPSRLKPTTAAAPEAELPALAKNSTAAPETLKPTLEAQVTQSPVQELNATVCLYNHHVFLKL